MKKKVKFIIPFFVLGSIVSGYVMFVAGKEAYRGKRIEQEIEKLKLQQEAIESENKELREKIAYLDSDQFRERIAKDKLNMKKEGEFVVEVRPSVNFENNDDILLENTNNESPQSQEIKNYKKWWKLFFNY